MRIIPSFAHKLRKAFAGAHLRVGTQVRNLVINMMKVDAHYLAMTKTSQKYQTVEGMICIAKPFKMIFRSADIADILSRITQ
jgi:hypothetical protein